METFNVSDGIQRNIQDGSKIITHNGYVEVAPADKTFVPAQIRDPPSQNVNFHTRGTSSHTEYGISPGFRGMEGSLRREGDESDWRDRLGPEGTGLKLICRAAHSNTTGTPSRLFLGSGVGLAHPLGGHDALSCSPERPSFMERAGGAMDQLGGWITGDKDRAEKGRDRRKFGSMSDEGSP
ncbi:hypothetical protein JCM10207_001423 [Rhodosporidiobolus poonsookiae]